MSVNFSADTAGYYMYMPSSSDELILLTPMQGTGITKNGHQYECPFYFMN
ncbi:hypothetical protein NST74_15325 [Paenibacillus sp. FSL F4-0125]